MSVRHGASPHVLLHVTGGIAAYKACEVLRALQRSGCDVRVCMSNDAVRFVGPVTFEALSHHPVATSLYTYAEGPIPHIDLSEWADVQAVVPATANILAKMAAGIVDDVVCATLLATTGPLVVAPAMNVRMWNHPATRANIEMLQMRGVSVVAPETGHLACGDIGEGKLARVSTIAEAVLAALRQDKRDLAGIRVLVTAGPTHEAIDPVRYIANASSGKMGYAIAAEAAMRGAEVTIVSGPVSLAAPTGTRVVPVVSASEMRDAALDVFGEADVAICAAAVADYMPAVRSSRKLKKSLDPILELRLVETADILAELSAKATRAQIVVGFAAETDDLLMNAAAKLAAKGCDLIVANDVSRSDSTFGADTNTVTFVSESGSETLPTMPKRAVAAALWDRVAALLARREG